MTRMVSFRISQDEFEQLRVKSVAVGARSVSDYARVALCSAAATNARIGTDVHDLNDIIEKLSCEIRRLSELLKDPGAPHHSGESPIASNHNGGLGNA